MWFVFGSLFKQNRANANKLEKEMPMTSKATVKNSLLNPSQPIPGRGDCVTKAVGQSVPSSTQQGQVKCGKETLRVELENRGLIL
jgi:hypothetical protein